MYVFHGKHFDYEIRTSWWNWIEIQSSKPNQDSQTICEHEFLHFMDLVTIKFNSMRIEMTFPLWVGPILFALSLWTWTRIRCDISYNPNTLVSGVRKILEFQHLLRHGSFCRCLTKCLRKHFLLNEFLHTSHNNYSLINKWLCCTLGSNPHLGVIKRRLGWYKVPPQYTICIVERSTSAH